MTPPEESEPRKRPIVAAQLLRAGFLAGAILVPWFPAAAASSDPSGPAVEWLRSVADGKTDPADGTALSDGVGDKRMAELRRGLNRLKDRLRPDDLQPLEEKQDGDLAGVIISQVTGFDATTIQVHAVAMVRSEGKWLPAPVPASFDGAGVLFNSELRQRARALEEWMIRARGEQFARLRSTLHARLAEEMRQSVDSKLLTEGDPSALVWAFTDACHRRDSATILALAGGLETPTPSDWNETVQAVSRVFSGELTTHPSWRLLAAPEVLRAVVHHERRKSEGMVSVVALDAAAPSGLPLRPRAIHLPLEKSASGRWRIRLPEPLRLPALDPGRAAEIAKEDAVIDADLIRRFPAKLRDLHPVERHSTSRTAAEALVKALHAPSPAAFVPLLDLSGDPAEAEASLIRCVRWWRDLRSRNDLRKMLLLDFQESGNEACAFVQRFSAARPGPSDLTPIFFRRDDDGWIAETDLIGENRGPARAEEALSVWLKESQRRLAQGWAADIVVPAGVPEPGSAPSEAEVSAVYRSWVQALEDRSPFDLLRLCARLPGEDSLIRALRNAGQDLLFTTDPEVLGVIPGGRWTGVSLRTTNRGSVSHPLLIFVRTPDGPRALTELDLAAPAGRPRELLNNGIFERVAAVLPQEAAEELRKLCDRHRDLAAEDRAARPEPTSE